MAMADNNFKTIIVPCSKCTFPVEIPHFPNNAKGQHQECPIDRVCSVCLMNTCINQKTKDSNNSIDQYYWGKYDCLHMPPSIKVLKPCSACQKRIGKGLSIDFKKSR